MGKSAGKSRLSGKRQSDDRSAKRHKAAAQHGQGSIRHFLQPLPRVGSDATDAASRDSSSEPEDLPQLPSQTPAVPLLAPPAPPPSGMPTAPGAMLQTVLLRSLQHRFATQQALDSPAGDPTGEPQKQQQQQHHERAAMQDPGAGSDLGDDYDDVEEEEDEEEGGFQIFSQLAYEPTFLSQRPAEPEEGPGPHDDGGHSISQLASQTQVLHWASSQHDPQLHRGGAVGQAGAGVPTVRGPAAAAAVEAGGGGVLDELDWPAGSQPQLTQSQHAPQQTQGDEAHRRASGVSMGGGTTLKTTPALQSAERVRCDAGGAAGASGQKMFPLFRRRGTMKKLYIVRHGESTYNAAMARGSSWEDPQIFDAQLTERGKQQALSLRQHLAGLGLPPDTLWLTSPLQRAMQTLLLGCPHAHMLGKGSSGSSGSAENSSAVPNGASTAGEASGCKAPTFMVLPSISEKVATCGDIGHPASELRKRYPQLGCQLAALPELWWHCPAEKPNCALQQCFGSSETKQQLLSRIGAFRRWLQDRPERVVVAVGHSSYWRAFEEVCTGIKPDRMRNCEYRLINF